METRQLLSLHNNSQKFIYATTGAVGMAVGLYYDIIFYSQTLLTESWLSLVDYTITY
jgi:hypothetical protein